jgi:receptor protein-tyrosine kinase
MTRLSEAFDRARATAVQEAELLVGRSWNDPEEVAQAWDIGEEPVARRQAQAPATHPDGLQPAVRQVRAVSPRTSLTVPPAAATSLGFQFNPTLRDKIVGGPLADPGLIERYNHIGAALHHAQTQRNVRTVMITSAVTAEGKSLTATNLALTLSHSYQRRVLLIDADLRHPMIHEHFQLPNDVGLGELLKRPTGRHLTLRQVSPTLWIQPAGCSDPEPMSALVSDAMKQLLAEAVGQFDWIVIDTPPIVVLPDASLLAAMVDTALVVIRANSTPYPLVKRAIEAIGQSKVLGVVLNGARPPNLGGAYESYQSYYGSSSSQPQPPVPRPAVESLLRKTPRPDND